MKNNYKEEFVDEKGNKSEIFLTSQDNEKIKLDKHYKLQRPESDNKYLRKDAKAKGVLTSDIGIKSPGFAPIFTLALIIALGALFIAYLLWRL